MPSTQAKPQVYSHLPDEDEVMTLEIKLLLQAIAFRYDYDFSHYAQASLTRRINNCLKMSQLNTIAEMIPKV